MMFHQRFSIEVGEPEARARFVTRIENDLFELFLDQLGFQGKQDFVRAVATGMGLRYRPNGIVEHYTDHDFHRTLEAIECLYGHNEGLEELIDAVVVRCLARAEVDLGVRWHAGQFLPSGAAILDEKLVNDPLAWLERVPRPSVAVPFRKGLQHFMEAVNREELRSDSITDMYEAVEATAKLVLSNDRDLSANREQFVGRLGLAGSFAGILKDYIAFGNAYRHAASEERPKKLPTHAETEAFLYLSGIIVRVALQSMGADRPAA